MVFPDIPRLLRRRGHAWISGLQGWEAVALLSVATLAASGLLLAGAGSGAVRFQALLPWFPAVTFACALALGAVLDEGRRRAWQWSLVLLFGVQFAIGLVVRLV